jgi:hypothetical protein
VLKAGRLVFNNKGSVVNCLVRGLDDTGADVRLEGALAFPDDLFLGVDDHLRPVRRVWQEGLNVGLEFI